MLAADGAEVRQELEGLRHRRGRRVRRRSRQPEKPRARADRRHGRLTAFAPTDKAFRRLVADLTGTRYKSEAKVFKKVAALGIDTVEQVLLYHVVPGATITAAQAVKADGAKLKTAAGPTLKVKVADGRVTLVDKDPDATNPTVTVPDINKGNKQIAHGIDRVLRPADL